MLTKNANINAKTNNDLTPLHIAVINNYYNIVNLLLTNNANITAVDKKLRTPLHISLTEKIDNDIITLLFHYDFLYKKRTIYLEDKDGLTPIHLAAKNGNHDIIELFINNLY